MLTHRLPILSLSSAASTTGKSSTAVHTYSKNNHFSTSFSALQDSFFFFSLSSEQWTLQIFSVSPFTPVNCSLSLSQLSQTTRRLSQQPSRAWEIPPTRILSSLSSPPSRILNDNSSSNSITFKMQTTIQIRRSSSDLLDRGSLPTTS